MINNEIICFFHDNSFLLLYQLFQQFFHHFDYLHLCNTEFSQLPSPNWHFPSLNDFLSNILIPQSLRCSRRWQIAAMSLCSSYCIIKRWVEGQRSAGACAWRWKLTWPVEVEVKVRRGKAVRTDKAVDEAEPTGAINHSLHMTNTPWETLLSCGWGCLASSLSLCPLCYLLPLSLCNVKYWPWLAAWLDQLPSSLRDTL